MTDGVQVCSILEEVNGIVSEVAMINSGQEIVKE